MDGIYVKAGLERDKAALLVVFRDLKARGVEAPRLLCADSNAAIWAAAGQVWPEAAKQRCWNHKILKVLDRLTTREHREARGAAPAGRLRPQQAKAV